MKTLGKKITELRKKYNMTQDQLATKMNVSGQAVSKWESEQSTPDLEKVIIMSDFFGVTTDYILKGIDCGKRKRNCGFYTGRILGSSGSIYER